MNDILVEFEKYISSNKEVLTVLPINTKMNRSKYVEKVVEFEETALKIRDIIWNEMQDRYKKLLDIQENPDVIKIQKNIESIGNIELFNEINTPYEKLGIDRIIHKLNCISEPNFDEINQSLKLFINKFKEYGINLTENDFYYSHYSNEYVKSFLNEPENSERLKNVFDKILSKCPDIATHIELNLRYLYYINSKKLEKELNERNEKILHHMNLDNTRLINRFFELNKELVLLEKTDSKYILGKFVNNNWNTKTFTDKEMNSLYEKFGIKNYFESSAEQKRLINDSFVRLLSTLYEYKIYKEYQYVIEDLKTKYRIKYDYNDIYEKKNKELRKKEQELIKESKRNRRNIKRCKSQFFGFIRKRLERKIYEFPVASTIKIKELKNLYVDLDEKRVNAKIAELVKYNSTIKDMFKMAISFYTYIYRITTQFYVDQGVNIDEKVQKIIDFMNKPYKAALSEIKLSEELKITEIISNKCEKIGIILKKEDLEDNLKNIIEDVEKIVDYYNIKKSNLKEEDIVFVEKVEQIALKRS